MLITTGIILAFVAMVFWGFGDFLIQKSSRKIGDWETLCIISFVGILMIAPFVTNSLTDLFVASNLTTLLVILGCGFIFFIASLLDFESLKQGKISVVESVWSTEILVSILLAYFILKESLGFYQIIFVLLLIAGLVMVSIKEKSGFALHRFFLEKGVLVAIGAAVAMGAANFMVGVGARVSDPVVIYFSMTVMCFIFSLVYLIYKGLFGKMISDFNTNKKLILSMSVADNLAWIAFTFAMTMAPIGIVVAVSESYIIISVILGFGISKEKLQLHQKLGLIFAFFGAVALALITV